MADRLNITIDQGSTFSLSFDVTQANGAAFDLTSYTASAQMRKHYTTSNSVAFSTAIANTNEITISLTSVETANIEAGRYVFDVEIDDGANTITRVVEGKATVTPEVTR